jgi:bifunctional non-homologous end joining protein LigD
MGGMRSKNPMRFVIQRHKRQGEAVHWDLMLEKNRILETYQVTLPPEEWGDEPVEAVKIFDHPLKFLTYEGSVNKGKGKVKITDTGTYEILMENENERRIELAGRVLKGEIQFRRIEGDRLVLRGNVEHRTLNNEL